MGDQNPPSPHGYSTGGSTTAAKISSIALVLAVLLFFLLVILTLFLYVYTHYFSIGRSLARRRAEGPHFIFAAGEPSIPSVGLNPSILFSLPISIYQSNDFKEGLECAVCLSELTDGEKVRLLPNCNHGFHFECIDMWFHSHSTCPLCRCPVGGEDGLHLPESESFDIEMSDLQLQGGRMLTISIPDRSNEMIQSSLPPLSSSSSQLEEMKSPFIDTRSPVKLNIGSLKRILSGGKMTGDSCSSSHVVNHIDQRLADMEK